MGLNFQNNQYRACLLFSLLLIFVCLTAPDNVRGANSDEQTRIPGGSHLKVVPVRGHQNTIGTVFSSPRNDHFKMADYAFPITVPAKKNNSYCPPFFFRASMVLPLTIWEPPAQNREFNENQMIYGIIYGILIAFIIYFAALAIRLYNLPAMWFTYYIVCLGLLIGAYQGDLMEILKQAYPDLNRIILITIIGFLYFTGAKFLRTFLNISFYSRRVDCIIQVLQWMGMGFIPMNLLPNPLTPVYSIALIGIGPAFSAGVSIFFWFRGVANAGYFTVGWIIGYIFSGIDLLRVFGIIPWMPGTLCLLTTAAILSVVFFSIAVMEQSREYLEFEHKDNLTGIANRNLFDQVLTIEWNRNLRNQQPLSVIMADIDEFRAFNDTYGYSKGDECLKTIARIFDRYLRRAGDLAARYGGEEFIAVLPDTLASEAAFLAEKIREAVETLAIKHESSEIGKIVTISLGTGTIVPSAEKTPADIVILADEALYKAKNGGRNRVISLDHA